MSEVSVRKTVVIELTPRDAFSVKINLEEAIKNEPECSSKRLIRRIIDQLEENDI